MSAPFDLVGGLAVVTAECTCSSNFVADVVDANTGRDIDLAVNVIGAGRTARTINAPPGRYVLNVTSNGPWTIWIDQPRPASGASPAGASFSGSGHAVIGPFMSTKALRIDATASGSSNFMVDAITTAGRSTLLANEIAPASSSKIFTPPGAIWFVDVDATGPWTFRFS